MTVRDPLLSVGTRATPQSAPADPRQVTNSAGGYTFVLPDLARLRRFLVLGVTSGTYYVGEREHTRDNAEVVTRLARDDGRTVVDEVVAVSVAGRAPRQNPALFALAAVAGLGDPLARAAALEALPQVARTGTHLFLFAGYVELFRGWGRGLRRAVAGWYTDRSADDLAYQVVKYRQREGWSHRDLLRLSHPTTTDPGLRAVLDWVAHGATNTNTPRPHRRLPAGHGPGHPGGGGARPGAGAPAVVGDATQRAAG